MIHSGYLRTVVFHNAGIMETLTALSLRQRLNGYGFSFPSKDDPCTIVFVSVVAIESKSVADDSNNFITVTIRAEFDGPFGCVKEAEDLLNELINKQINESKNDALEADFIESIEGDEIVFIERDSIEDEITIPVWLSILEYDPDDPFSIFFFGIKKKNGDSWPTDGQWQKYERLFIVDVDKAYYLYSLPNLPDLQNPEAS